jgi:hypothetical protein
VTTPHPADGEARGIDPTAEAREHSPNEQVQPPDADAVDLYGEQ